jgi:hypothetical protein
MKLFHRNSNYRIADENAQRGNRTCRIMTASRAMEGAGRYQTSSTPALISPRVAAPGFNLPSQHIAIRDRVRDRFLTAQEAAAVLRLAPKTLANCDQNAWDLPLHGVGVSFVTLKHV